MLHSLTVLLTKTGRGAIKVYENITKLSDSGLSSSTPNFDSDHNPQHLREKALSVYRVEQGVQALDAQYLTLEVYTHTQWNLTECSTTL